MKIGSKIDCQTLKRAVKLERPSCCLLNQSSDRKDLEVLKSDLLANFTCSKVKTIRRHLSRFFEVSRFYGIIDN